VCLRRTRIRIHYTLLAFLFVPGTLGGQSVSPGSGDHDQATIEQLVEQVKQLQQQDRELLERIKVLEAKQPQASPTPTPEADSTFPASLPQLAQEIPPPQTPSGLPRDWHDVHGVELRGFGEVNYQALNQRKPELGVDGFVPGSAGNFYTGDFGLFLTSRLTNKASVLSEIIFEEGGAQSYSVDLRRVLLKYDYNDHLRLSFGRYQTGIGYYNWAFRSAAWLQTTADRPLVMQFASDGGLLPTQAIGVSTTGAIPSGRLGLH